MAAPTPQQLTTLASQYGQFEGDLAKWAIIYLLKQAAGNNMTPAQLATAASAYAQFEGDLAQWAIIYLLQQLVNEE